MGTGASASIDAAATAASPEALEEAIASLSGENQERIAKALEERKAWKAWKAGKALEERKAGGGDRKRAVQEMRFEERSGDEFPRSTNADDVARAWYGLPGHEWTDECGVDVTDIVKARVRDGQGVCASNDLFGDPILRRKKELVVEVYETLCGGEDNPDFTFAAAAHTDDLQLRIEFMGGEPSIIKLNGSELIRDVKAKVAASLGKEPGVLLKLMFDGRVLNDSEKAAPLAGCVAAPLQGVWCKTETSYIIMKDGEAVLVDEGDDGWTEEMAEKSQIAVEKWVPEPESNNAAGCKNLARLSLGVKVEASSRIFPNEENLLNVLRLGSKHGDPRMMGGDNSFIFGERQNGQVMTLDFGRAVTILRIGTMCYGDRWLDFLAVSTKESADDEEWTLWGESRQDRRGGGVAYFDREPTKARLVRFKCTSGHYHGAGARLGPVFAWGFD